MKNSFPSLEEALKELEHLENNVYKAIEYRNPAVKEAFDYHRYRLNTMYGVKMENPYQPKPKKQRVQYTPSGQKLSILKSIAIEKKK